MLNSILFRICIVCRNSIRRRADITVFYIVINQGGSYGNRNSHVYGQKRYDRD